MCPTCNGPMVPCRRLHFEMAEDTHARWLGTLTGHMVRVSRGGEQIVTGHTDGMGCPACETFVPNGEVSDA